MVPECGAALTFPSGDAAYRGRSMSETGFYIEAQGYKKQLAEFQTQCKRHQDVRRGWFWVGQFRSAHNLAPPSPSQATAEEMLQQAVTFKRGEYALWVAGKEYVEMGWCGSLYTI